MNKNFNIKEGNEANDMMFLAPKMFIVWGYFLMFANSRNLPVNITNIIHKFSVSTSNTHPDGRAIDASTSGWSASDINDCIEFVVEKAGELGAISKIGGKPNVIYYHNAGLGDHFHLQVSR